MKSNKQIAEILDEPACEHNKKSKSGCAKPVPGASAGGCAFDGAQIALLPIVDVAHIVHSNSHFDFETMKVSASRPSERVHGGHENLDRQMPLTENRHRTARRSPVDARPWVFGVLSRAFARKPPIFGRNVP